MITFQNLTEGLPYTEKPEFQSHGYNYAKDTGVKEDSFKEENPMGTSTSINKDHLVYEWVRQSSGSPPLIHCSGETLKSMEMLLAISTTKESALKPSPHQRLCCTTLFHKDF